MRNFVIISGCSGGGKSTLLDALAARGFSVVSEPGRRIVKEELACGGTALPWVDPTAFIRRTLALAAADYEAARKLSGEWIFFDRGFIDAAIALQYLSGEEVSIAQRYYPRVFFTPPWPEIYATDAERRHNYDAAVAEYERLLRAYPARGYEIATLPKSGVEERAAFVIETLRG